MGKIGVMDSGVGGLTLVKELMELCPGEDIVYFGDSANCPYGNRTQEDIFGLSMNMLRFMGEQGVKAVAIACNTISALVEPLSERVEMPLFSIVAPVAEEVATSGLDRVGVFATEFTISTGIYTRLIQASNPAIAVFGKGSPNLATLVDGGAGDTAVEEEIRTELGRLLRRVPLRHVILGCTHFPIVVENFTRCFPDITFINPAKAQARAIKRFLEEGKLSNPGEKGRRWVYTSGGTEVYRSVLERLSIPEPAALESITL